jgi:tellurite resistance protein TehA-like permease
MFPVDAFAIINFLVALFVLVFALFYLRQVWNTKSKKPWLCLFCAVVVLFVLQAANLLSIAGYFSMDIARWIFDLVFLIVLLFTLIFQYYLLSTSEKHHSKKKK